MSDELRKTFHLAEGTLQVVVTHEGVILDAFVGDEHVGTRAELASDLFDGLVARQEQAEWQHLKNVEVPDREDS